MKKKLENYAFIDGQNLNLGVQDLGWKLDFKRFRIYLKEKYGVTTAYYFIGKVEEYQELYDALNSAGYTLVYKEVLTDINGKTKGNIDAELVLTAMSEYKKYKKAIIVSGDGDFACLVTYLDKKKKLERVIVPNYYSYSSLLKKAAGKHLDSMNVLKKKLEYKFKKDKTKTSNKLLSKKQIKNKPKVKKQTPKKSTITSSKQQKTFFKKFRTKKRNQFKKRTP